MFTTTTIVPEDISLLTVNPHMHLLGRAFEMTATLPDGTVKPMVKIDDWDFNWQDQYRLAEPLRLPAGTVINMKYIYDNSAGNIRNPNSPPSPP